MSQFSQEPRADHDPSYTAEQYINVANCITPLLKTFGNGVAASYQYSNDNEQSKEVKAFAKLSGRDWTYFIKSLRISFGRNTDNIEDLKKLHAKSENANDDNLGTSEEFRQDSGSSNIDLGPAKTVSRKHGAIEFNRETGNWELIISGRNGAKLNYRRIKGSSLNTPILLNSGDIIDIGGVQMLFVLPDQIPTIDQRALKYMIPKIIEHYGMNGNNNPLLQDMIRNATASEGPSDQETLNMESVKTGKHLQIENPFQDDNAVPISEPFETVTDTNRRRRNMQQEEKTLRENVEGVPAAEEYHSEVTKEKDIQVDNTPTEITQVEIAQSEVTQSEIIPSEAISIGKTTTKVIAATTATVEDVPVETTPTEITTLETESLNTADVPEVSPVGSTLVKSTPAGDLDTDVSSKRVTDIGATSTEVKSAKSDISNNSNNRDSVEKSEEPPRKKFRISSISSRNQYKESTSVEPQSQNVISNSQTTDKSSPSTSNVKTSEVTNNDPRVVESVTSNTGISQVKILETNDVSKSATPVSKIPSRETTPNNESDKQSKLQKNNLPAPYGSLITEGILSTENGAMSLSEIYTYLLDKYPYFSTTTANWQNSVRHTLSVNAAFSKIPRKKVSSTGKGMVWSIDKKYRDEFLKKWKLGYAQHNRKNPAVDSQLVLFLAQNKTLPEPYDNEIKPSEIKTQDMSQANGISMEIRRETPYYS